MFRAACRRFTESATNTTCLRLHADCFTVCHKQNIPKAACRLFHRVCHQHTMFRATCFSQSATNTCPGLHADCFRVCHKHSMFRACRLFHRVCHKYNMFRAACRCFTESATNIACLGLHADCFTGSATNMFRAAYRLFHRVCHKHNITEFATNITSATHTTCLRLHADCFTVCHKQNIPKAACRLFHSLSSAHHVQGCMH